MQRTTILLYAIGVVLLIAAFFGWNDVIELRAEEPRRAIVSLEMLLSGNYWVPKIHGWSYYNKPPAFNWWMILWFKVFGSQSEWAVRFPSLLSFIATAALVFAVARKHLSTFTALLAAIIFLTSGDLLVYGSVNAGEIDLFFTMLVVAQALSIFVFHSRREFLWLFLCSYVLAAIGTLTKGPPSIAFQGLTLLPWLIIQKDWKELLGWKHFLGIGLYTLMVGGYFAIYNQYDDAVGFMVRLFKEASQRTGVEQSIWPTVLASFSFPLFLLKLMAPWSLLVLLLFRKDLVATIRSNSLLSFCVVFFLFNIPLYWFTADHKPRYIYMFFPFISILLAYFFENTGDKLNKVKNGFMGLMLTLMVAAGIAFLATPFIPYLNTVALVDHLVLKGVSLFLATLLLLGIFWKTPPLRIIVIGVFMLLLRVGLNLIYLPAVANTSDRLSYRQDIDQVLKVTNGQPVRWYGKPYTFQSDASIGPITIHKSEVTTAPLVSYQVPYYLSKATGTIMHFDTSLVQNQFYLVPDKLMENLPYTELYRFPDHAFQRELVLFKVDSKQSDL